MLPLTESVRIILVMTYDAATLGSSLGWQLCLRMDCIRCPYHVCVSKISKLSSISCKPFDNFGLANPIHLLIIVLRTHVGCELYFHRHFAREKNLLDPNTTIKTIRKLFPPTKKDRLVFLLQLLHLQVQIVD